MNGEIVDGVLNFFVNYDMFINKPKTLDIMDSYSMNGNVEG